MKNLFYQSSIFYGLLSDRTLKLEGICNFYNSLPDILRLKTMEYQAVSLKERKSLQRIVVVLSITPLFMGCTSPFPQAHSEHTSMEITQPIVTAPLKAAIEELRVMKIKIGGGISQKEYGEDLTDLENIVNNAYGDPKALAAVKSAVQGHKLAIQFWRCDRLTGHDELYQCRDKVLKSVFKKYPDIEEQAKAAVAGENLSYISAGLDKDAVLQAIWGKTGQDTDVALEAINPVPNPKRK